MRFLVAVLVLAFSAGMARSEPVEWPVSEGGNGHFYEIVASSQYAQYSWLDQFRATQLREFAGLKGHLATITSAEEHTWVTEHLLETQVPHNNVLFLGGWNDGFVSGSDNPQSSNWHWITGEAWDYAAWASGEPSDTGPNGSEYALSYLWYWNDNYPQTGFNDLTFEYQTAGQFGLVEYDNLVLSDLPPLDHPIPVHSSTWGEIKSLYR